MTLEKKSREAVSLVAKEAEVGKDFLASILGPNDPKEFKTLHEEITFDQYVARVMQNPKLVRTAYQRVYDMIMEPGFTTYERYRKTVKHYKFFDHGDEPVFGLDETIGELVQFFRGAAGHYGSEKRILLLHGPVGSSKSTICRAIKRGMERYSRTPSGAWYTYKWVNLPTGQHGIYNKDEEEAAMHEDPILFLTGDHREKFFRKINAIHMEQTPEKERVNQYTLIAEGDLNPRSKLFLNELLKRYDGNLLTVLDKHVRVVRKIYSEPDRIGIGTFQPKDEKNQDATELTGDSNYAQLANFGSDSDPRAFNFDGELCVSNRGVCEFIEILKLAREFLYDLLGASQEHSIKPKKFSQLAVDEVIIGHTNDHEFQRLVNDPSMEAIRDRTNKISVPYLLRWSDETKIYERDYGNGRVRQHIAPHTLEIAALFAVMTRLQEDKDGKLDLRDKVKLYDGRSLPNYTEDTVKELMDKAVGEGMQGGLGPRFIQDQISATLTDHHDYINPFMVLSKLKSRLRNSSLINDQSDIARYEGCIDKAIKELNEILKNEVQRALVADENAIIRLCSNYVDNLVAYMENRKLKDPFTGADVEPNERLMREIEEKIDIPETHCDDFRRQIMIFMGTLSNRNQKFSWDSNPQLKRALEAKLFEDSRDTIKLATISSNSHAVDPEQQAKIDAIKGRLIKHYGYNEQSATDVLNYVATIFARGDVIED